MPLRPNLISPRILDFNVNLDDHQLSLIMVDFPGFLFTNDFTYGGGAAGVKQKRVTLNDRFFSSVNDFSVRNWNHQLGHGSTTYESTYSIPLGKSLCSGVICKPRTRVGSADFDEEAIIIDLEFSYNVCVAIGFSSTTVANLTKLISQFTVDPVLMHGPISAAAGGNVTKMVANHVVNIDHEQVLNINPIALGASTNEKMVMNIDGSFNGTVCIDWPISVSPTLQGFGIGLNVANDSTAMGDDTQVYTRFSGNLTCWDKSRKSFDPDQ